MGTRCARRLSPRSVDYQRSRGRALVREGGAQDRAPHRRPARPDRRHLLPHHRPGTRHDRHLRGRRLFAGRSRAGKRSARVRLCRPAGTQMNALSLILALAAGQPAAPVSPASAFQKLEGLVGTWHVAGETRSPLRIRFYTTAGGTVLVEEWRRGDAPHSLTLYHLDGGAPLSDPLLSARQPAAAGARLVRCAYSPLRLPRRDRPGPSRKSPARARFRPEGSGSPGAKRDLSIEQRRRAIPPHARARLSADFRSNLLARISPVDRPIVL